MPNSITLGNKSISVGSNPILINTSNIVYPSITITMPNNGTSYTSPASIIVAANSSITSGTIQKVEFYNGNTLLTTITSTPYTFTWTNVTNGSYTITAKAYSNLNIVTTSAPIIISVTTPSTPSTAFTVPLTTPSKVSAGIYYSNNKLVRTQVSGQNFTTDPLIQWDGYDDNGNLMPDGNYTAKSVSGNVNFVWVGGAGNNSTNKTGSTVYTHYSPSSMCFPGNGFGYMSHTITENNSPFFKFDTNLPHEKIDTAFGFTTYQTYYQMCSDGTKVYAASYSPGWFIYAFTLANEGVSYQFANSTPLQSSSSTIMYGIDVVADPGDGTTPTNAITGVAVQITGNVLFSGHLDRIHLLDKTTGALISEYMIPATKMVCDKNDNLWIVSNNSVQKYTVSGDNTLTLSLTLTGLTTPAYLDCSPDNSTIAVLDAGTQQILFYNQSTGAYKSTLGQLNGYYASPVVANDRFYFRDDRTGRSVPISFFVTYQPDGSFWVGDGGNNRILKFTGSGTYLDYIMWQPQSYYMCVDKGNINSVWSGYLNFHVDYTDVNNLSWYLANNYGAHRKPSNVGQYYDASAPQNYFTYTNGRTYCLDLLEYDSAPNKQIVEVIAGGDFRATGVSYNVAGGVVDTNLNVLGYNYLGTGYTVDFVIQQFLGMDGSRNPTYATNNIGHGTMALQYQLAASSIQSNYPLSPSSLDTRFSDGTLAVFDPQKANTGYHVGYLPSGATDYNVITAPTLAAYQSLHYPENDGAPVNNVKNYYGGPNFLLDDRFYTAIRCEGWGYGADLSNIWNIYHKNGLFITQFGTTTNEATEQAGYGQAANIISGTVFNANGKTWVAHPDESSGGKIHFWYGDFSTVTEHTFNLVKSGTPVITYPYTKMMDGLPKETTLTTGGATMPAAITTYGNWTINAPAPSDTSQYIVIRAGNSSFLRGDNDLLIQSRASSTTHLILTRDLEVNIPLTNWKLDGNIAFPDGLANGINYQHGNFFINILDNNNKIIAQFTCSNIGGEGNYFDHGFELNGQNVFTDTNSNGYKVHGKYQPFEVVCNGTSMSLIYNSNTISNISIFDNTGNILYPKTFQIDFHNDGTLPEVRVLNIGSLQLYKNF